MTSRAAIKLKIASLRRYLNTLQKLQKTSVKDLKEDEILRGAVERYLYLICQSAIDLAEQLIAHKKLSTPQNASEAFRILAEADLINDKLAKRLIGMVGFRNILAHGYEKIDYEIVKKILVSGRKDILDLIQDVESEL